MILMIVESPSKIKTVRQCLPARLRGDVKIMASVGHVRDLPKSKLGVDRKTFKPSYRILAKKQKVVKALRAAKAGADEVWLATDDDREGEAIAWHLCAVLKLNPAKTRRLRYHALTPAALRRALAAPRSTVDLPRVEAQHARRILDRLHGYTASPAVGRALGRRGLSAGRVQSAALALVVRREQQLQDQLQHPMCKWTALAKFREVPLARLAKPVADPSALAAAFPTSTWTITKLEQTQRQVPAPPPFTTSTLQQKAPFTASKTMKVAQQLYQQGYITYLRTDSTALASSAVAQGHAYLVQQGFDASYHATPTASSSKRAQNAHEAIRPTQFDRPLPTDPDQRTLYQLVHRRTLQALMVPAQVRKHTIELGATGPFVAHADRVEFLGWKALDPSDPVPIPWQTCTVGQKVTLKQVCLEPLPTSSITRYTESTLVKELERKGVGRPSTYAATLDALFKKRKPTPYVTKKAVKGVTLDCIKRAWKGKIPRKETQKKYRLKIGFSAAGALSPSPLGQDVYRVLAEKFSQLVDVRWTSVVEDQLDQVEAGTLLRNDVIKNNFN